MTDIPVMTPSAEERAKARAQRRYTGPDAYGRLVTSLAADAANDFRDGVFAERARLIAELREPSGNGIEVFSRLAHPGAWRKIDDNINDDDWGGSTALNLRRALLRDAVAERRAAADWLEKQAGME